MKLEMNGQMRMEQRMKLAPRMIQSMEILQLPILALQERIEQELNSNPVLELEQSSNPDEADISLQRSGGDVKTDQDDKESEKIEDFGRVDRLDDDYKDYLNRATSFRMRRQSGERDKKLEAIKNTAAPQQSLHEYLSNQWRLVDAEDAVKRAGSKIIDYLDDKGYLTVRIEQLHNKDKAEFTIEDLHQALKLVQTLEPAGVGARDLRESLLIQIDQSSDDMSFERIMLAEHMDKLLENHLPEIAGKMKCSIDKVNRAVERMSKFDTSPGLQIGQTRNRPITADVIVEPSNSSNGYDVKLTDSDLPVLQVSSYYAKMAKDSRTGEETREFLRKNIRSAKWIIDAIQQRKATLLKVAEAIVKHQREFFDKGQLFLKPLPMSKIADEVGIHLATVSRAVSGKYLQCSLGILPLRKFFSGGTRDVNGKAHSWHAVRARLQQIINEEDKTKPLSDDKIRKKLEESGIDNLARRTVAKYRKIMNIPAARFRKKYQGKA